MVRAGSVLAVSPAASPLEQSTRPPEAPRGRPRKRRAARIVEPPRHAQPRLRGVVDAHPGPSLDPPGLAARHHLKAQVGPRVAKIPAVVGSLDRECGADQPGTGSQARRRRTCQSIKSLASISSPRHRGTRPDPIHPGRAHLFAAADRLNSPNQQCRCPPLGLRDYVQTVMHSVDKVHVRDSGRTEHDCIASRAAGAGMGRQVFLPDVGLHFHDSAGSRVWTTSADEVHADEPSCGRKGVLGEKLAREWPAAHEGRRHVRGRV